jgi:hypothetical protein
MKTKRELLKDLLSVDCKLSPENLTCDGELPRAEVNRRARRLNKEREEIIALLGYTPTDEEIWHADD